MPDLSRPDGDAGRPALTTIMRDDPGDRQEGRRPGGRACPRIDELPPPPPGRKGWPWTEESPRLPDRMVDGRPWPRISVVTPSYNQGAFLEETIRSVLLQGYPDVEYFVYDGGSDDESQEILEKYAPWLSYWTSEPDRGQSHAINKGWQRAHGAYLAWLCSDDIYTPGTFGRVAEVGRRHPEAGIVYGQSRLMYVSSLPDERSVVGRRFRTADLLTARSVNNIAQPSAFVSREALNRCGRLDERLHQIMDIDLWVRVGLRFERVFVPEVWSQFRSYEGQKSGQQASGLERLRLLDKIYGLPDLPADVARVRRQSYAFVYWRYGLWLLGEGAWLKGLRALVRAAAWHPGIVRHPLLRAPTRASVRDVLRIQ